mgnify:CR=1 FL=1
MRQFAPTALLIAAAFSLPATAQTSNATVTQLVGDATRLKAAENVLTLTDGRVLVTYNGGINELRGLPNGPVTVQPLTAPNCYYAGIVEWKGYVYAVCSDNFGLPISGARMVAAPVTADLANTAFRSIASLSNVAGPNGMAVSETGVFYFADSGLYLPSMPGKVVALTLSSPTVVASQKTVYNSLGRPNGVRYDRNAKAVYFTENPVYNGTALSNLKRATPNGTNAFSQTTTVLSLSGYLDDFTLSSSGAVLTNAGNNTVIHYNEQTKATTVLSGAFGQPTSVGFRCPTCNDLLVTDLKNNAVYSMVPTAPLSAR